jgi:cytochrome c oxidase subunit 2
MMNLYKEFSEWLYVALACLILGCSAVFALKYVSAHTSGGGGPALAIDDPIRLGEELYQSSGCMACHQPMDSSIAPTLYGIYGTERPLASGETVVADDAYLKESILYSKAKVTKGYAAAMPGYETVFDEEEVAHLIAYIRSL